MKPLAPARELLEYLQDLGYDTLRPPTPAARSTGARAGASTGAPPGVEVPELVGDAATRAGKLAEIAALAKECTACKLCERRSSVVFGDGYPNADLMFIGEGPGANEDRQGLPFVGAAGDLLNKIIAAIGFSREAVYIANIVKCRPPGNRDPSFDEVVACRGFLEHQIDLVDPKVIVLLGRIAAQSMMEVNTPIGRMRGQWVEVRGRSTMITYHPAALLRNASLKRPVWEDMQRVRDRLKAYGA